MVGFQEEVKLLKPHFNNDLAYYLWLLVIFVEVADLVFRRVRSRLHKKVQVENDG